MKLSLKRKTRAEHEPVIGGHVVHFIDYKKPTPYHFITLGSAVIGFAIVGSFMLTGSFAATRQYIAFETESGTRTGNTTVKVDTTAAGGSALSFDAPPAATCPSGQTGTPPNCVTPPTDPTVISYWGAALWHDEFSTSSVDASRWGVYHNNYGSGNNELECNTPSNVGVSAGILTITGKKQTYACPQGGTKNYTSAFLGSRDATTARYYPLYGRFEIKAKVPHGQGLWPAFWLRHKAGSSAAEVDIVELFHNQSPGKVTSTLHFPNSIGSNVSKKSTAFETAVQGTGGWHTFAVEIVPASAGAVKFTFFVDNAQTLTYTNTNASSWTNGYETAAWDIAVNLAIGGNWVGAPDAQLGYLPYPNKCSLSYSTPANNDPTTCSKTGIWFASMATRDAVYQVDYVRVWKYPN